MEPISSTSNSESARWRQGIRWWLLLILTVVGLNTAAAALLDILTLRSGSRFSLLYSRRIPKSAALIIGNSRAVNTFYIPALSELAGHKVVNLAYNGMGMRIAEALLHDAIEQNGPPQKVLIEVTAVLGGADLMNNIRLYSRFSPRLRELDQSLYPVPATVARLFPLYAYNGEMTLRVLHYLRQNDQAWINRNKITDATLDEISKGPAVRLATDPQELLALQRTLRWLHESGIPYRLVLGPYLPAYIARIENLAEWQREIEQACGTSITNLANAVASTEGFADAIHLNELGGRLVAPQVIQADLL